MIRVKVIPAAPNVLWMRRTIQVVVAFLVLGLIVSALLPLQHRDSPYHGNWGRCLSNVHQIGLAIQLYQNDFGGSYPENVDQLLQAQQIQPREFICPASNDIPATGPTDMEMLANLHTPGHLSYVYLGTGLSDKTVTPDMVILYESGVIYSTPEGDQTNLLMGNGNTLSVDPKVAAKITTAAAMGQRVHLANGVVWTTANISTTQR